jgi:hypothetical protein
LHGYTIPHISQKQKLPAATIPDAGGEPILLGRKPTPGWKPPAAREVGGKEQLLNKFHNAFGEIREDDSSFLQTLFN